LNDHTSTLRIHDVKTRLLWNSSSSLASIKRPTEGKRRYLPTIRTLSTENSCAAKAVISTSSEALRVMNLANESKMPQDAELAGQTLLELTFPPDAMASNSLESRRDLHRCFLVVASLCLAHPSQVLLGLELTRRAQILSIPFHLPLYQKLVTALALEQKPDQRILEVASWACLALNTSLQSSFFAEAMVALVKQNRFREARDLIFELKERHDIERLDGYTTTRMLCQLRANLREADATNGIINGSDAAQLAVHLEHFLWCDIQEYRVYKLQLLKAQNQADEHELQSATRNLNDTLSQIMKNRRPEEIAQIMDALENESENETESDSEDEDDNYQPDYDDTFDLSQSLEEAIEEIVKEVKERTHYQDDESSSDSGNEGEFDCDSDHGEVDYDAEMNEMVAFENKVLDVIDPEGPRFTILKGVKAVAWLKKKYEGQENIQNNVGHDKLTSDKACINRDIYEFDGIDIDESDSDEDDSDSDSDLEDESHSDEDDSDDDYSSDSSSSFHDAMTNDIVYLRDSSSWVLPDVTSQLTKLNNGRDLLYTRKFEEQLLNTLSSEEEEDEDDDFIQ